MEYRNRKSGGSKAMLLLTGLIWGVAFVAQSEGMNYVGAFTFNCCRFMIGGVMLIPCIFFLRSIGAGENGHVSRGQRQQQRHMAVIGGICCGLVICVASTLQQMGIAQTTVGKAGFITALYCGNVSFMYYGRIFHWTGRFSGIFMCYWILGSYFGN